MSEAAVPLPVPAEPPAPRASRWKADVALVVAAFFFGTTFVVVQDAVEDAEPVPFLAVRFLIGGAVLWLLGRGRAGTPGELRHGLAAGAALLVGYVMQTVGLQYTTPSTSAFITYLLVVFVPLLTFVVLGRRPHPLTVVGLVLAVTGLVLLTGGADTAVGRGEVLTLGCAVAFAAHIVILGETAGRHDAIRLTGVQVTAVGLACLLVGLAGGGLDMTAAAYLAAAFTGVFATALAFFALVWAQRIVSPSRAALILLLEPVFAVLLAWATGDPLTAAAVAGGGLILTAVVVAEVLPSYLSARRLAGEAGHTGAAAHPAPDDGARDDMADMAETIDDSAHRMGRHAWVEMRLFEILGRWSATVAEPRAQALLASQSRHHAWHAELWHDLLPAVPHLRADALVAPDEATAEIVAALDAVEGDRDNGASDAVAELAALYERVLPRLTAVYDDHLARTTAVTDGPTIRALRLVLADLAGDRRAGDDLLRSLRPPTPG